ncbi:ankyrin repeat-containing domain protein [Mycena galopus ATCC 62051]|nr:ankyrin repeat-containing domain protein [Mycena galopus ATCC 62051]
MTVLAELPPELLFYIVTFLTRQRILDPKYRLAKQDTSEPELQPVPDLPSINALAQTSSIFHQTLNEALYDLCASIEPLGKLALLFAVEHELETSVDRLIAAGVSLESEFRFDGSWGTVLHVAADLGLRSMVSKLLGLYGEDVMAMIAHAPSNRRYTALDYAVFGGHLEIVRILAPIPMPSSGDSIDVPPGSNAYLGAALILAVSVGNIEICEYLISQGADANFVGLPGCPALFYAFDNLALVQLLLASGADPNLWDRHGKPLLFSTSDIDVARTLYAAGTNIHAEDGHASNVLPHVRTIELLRFFLECGVDPNHEDDTGCTPLHRCISTAEFSKAAIELLLQFGAVTVEKPDVWGRTPVDLAIARGRRFLEVVEIFEPLVQNPDLRAKIAAFRRT